MAEDSLAREVPDRRVYFDVDASFARDYRIVHRDGSAVPPGRAQPISDGGAGVVYRTVFKGQLNRAVKFLDPRPELRSTSQSEKFLATFHREIAILANITHTRVAKIMDLSDEDHMVGDERFPWYAMELVEAARHLGTAVWEDEDLTGHEFLRLMDELLDGLVYLHAQGVMHCDVKDKNVLVQKRGDGFSLVLVDLGVAKVVRPSALGVPIDEGVAPDQGHGLPAGLSEDDVTLFFSTERIVKQAWRDRLKHGITRRELMEMFPSHDLHGFGLLVEDALTTTPLRQRLEADLGSSAVAALETVKDRLLCEPGSEYYGSTQHLRDDWKKLGPGYLAPLDIPELAVAAEAATSIATPTGRVSLSKRMVAALNHPAMQRLRDIPQLEFAHLVYPGATHTRLLHALSSFDMARRYIAHLLRDPEFRLMMDKADIEAALLWSLIHDIGHYPLSHMFEDLSEEEHQRHFHRPRTIPTDEDLFWAFVAPERLQADFRCHADAIQSELTDRHGRSFADYLRASGLMTDDGFDRLCRIDTPTELKYRVLRGIVSSHVDIDKVAYLTDDSAMSGVRYGLGIDIDALLASLRVPNAADLASDDPPGVIAITDKGLPAAEGVILARYWMLKRVYWHHTNRALIAMTKYVIRELLDSGRLEMTAYCARMLRRDARHALRYLSDAFDDAVRDEVFGDVAPRNPLTGILGGERGIYKRLLAISRGRDKERYNALAFRGRDDLAPIVEGIKDALRESLPAQYQLRTGDVIVDIPVKPREAPDAPVLVYLQDGTPGEPIENVSPVIRSLGDEFDAHVKKCRIFVHPDVAEALGPKLGEVRDDVRDVLPRVRG